MINKFLSLWFISKQNVKIGVDSRIQTGIKVKYNKPDIVVIDKVKKQIDIIEVGITSYENLKTVETEKSRKYDLLANHMGVMYKFPTRIIPIIMTKYIKLKIVFVISIILNFIKKK